MSGKAMVRRALVTGSTSGIGKAVAERLAKDGVDVIVHGRDARKTDTVAAELGAVDSVSADLSSDLGIGYLADYARHADLDILINNAGELAGQPDDLVEAPLADFRRAMTVHAWAGHELAKAVVPGMIARDSHSRLVWIGTEGAIDPVPMMAPYLVSKAVVPMLARLWAIETRDSTITSNTVLVGPTRTEGAAAQTESIAPGLGPVEVVANFYPGMLAGRMLEPAEVAEVVVWLCRPELAAIRGAAVRADGGVIPSVL